MVDFGTDGHDILLKRDERRYRLHLDASVLQEPDGQEIIEALRRQRWFEVLEAHGCARLSAAGNAYFLEPC